ncbi:hypothetical protein I4U23_006001 [Adineta vaga]|nr:hypothetical protein I4U23_006001 [Adineta vaga]
MYAPPPPVVAAAPRRSGLAASGPLLAICCLLFILFIIASTIVLALIPVYINRDIDERGLSPLYYASMDPDQDLPAGTLTGNSAANIGAASENALGLTPGSMPVQGGTSVDTIGKRKRRGFGILRERRQSRRKTFCPFRFNLKKCAKCGFGKFRQSIKVYTITVTIFLFELVTQQTNTYTVTYTITLIFTSFTPPSLSNDASNPGSGAVTGKLQG